MRLPLRQPTALVAVALLALGLVVAPRGAEPASAASSVDWGDLTPDGLTLVGDAPDDDPLHLSIGPTADTAGIEAEALAVNDPASPRYGEEATVAEIAARFVSDAAIEAIVTTLTDAGAQHISVHETRAFVVADLTVAEAESIFGVTWGRYTADGVEIDVPEATPVLPPSLEGHVASVYGAVAFEGVSGPTSFTPHAPAPSIPLGVARPATASSYDGGTPTRTGTPDPAACAGMLSTGGLLPDQLQAAYGLDALYAEGVDGAGVRLAVVDASRYYASDVQVYRDCIGVEGTSITDHVIGNPGYDGGTDEASLDLEVISAMAPGLERFDEFMVGSPNVFPAGEFIDYIAAPFDTTATGGADPDIVSLSYIVCEPAYETDPMASAAFAISEQILATAAAARITYVVASSDSGSSSCAHYYRTDDTTVAAAYPATSRWVTAVGGTNLTLSADNAIESSGTWNDNSYPAPYRIPGTGGIGGISSLVARPSWQDGLVPAASGRGVPDVALFSDVEPGWPIFTWEATSGTHSWFPVGGTSAATPLVASMVALVDQVDAARGQPSLGWLNPLLYGLAATEAGEAGPFLDIVLGNNAVFDAVDVYRAGPGYDFATGLGSFFADRLAAVLADPSAPAGGAPLEARPSSGDPAVVTFTASPVLHGGVATSYAWDFDGDGRIDEVTPTAVVEHTYGGQGTHTASVRVDTSLARSATFTVDLSTGDPGVVSPMFTG